LIVIFFSASFLLCILDGNLQHHFCSCATFYVVYWKHIFCFTATPFSLPNPFCKCLLCFCLFHLDLFFWDMHAIMEVSGGCNPVLWRTDDSWWKTFSNRWWDIIEYHENKRTGGLYRDNEKSKGIWAVSVWMHLINELLFCSSK